MTSPNEARHVLEERARKLARPLANDATQAAGIDMLTFSVSRERFAIDSRYVFAVFMLVDLVPLPGATAPVVGVTRWRGDVLTVIDLRGLVGAATNALDDLGRVIVVGASNPEFGILADTLGDIARLDTARLYPPTANRPREAHAMLLGVTADAIHVVDVVALIARQTDVRTDAAGASSPSSSATP
jgi:purine-binding chemotaxis protein CheW